eukprot:CAMPEP_0194510484 /NCGR_PEP_ID=MMETSP0253-20130528/41838_1 /TAXON_ID=2966 /ORGANISM="Noctiluca scintillans" /LENGTH=41 /DNA_ID= /DNA_START= /DNA_END= /DNA_ORIENTATION=
MKEINGHGQGPLFPSTVQRPRAKVLGVTEGDVVDTASLWKL